MHSCDGCPHDLTVVKKWGNGKVIAVVPIAELSDEDLLCEYAAEVDGDTRRISSDAPSNQNELYAEILRRMKK